MNQIELILEVTDPPSDADIAAINSPYTVTMLESLKKEKSTSLAELFPNAPPDAISLLGGLLQVANDVHVGPCAHLADVPRRSSTQQSGSLPSRSWNIRTWGNSTTRTASRFATALSYQA